MTLRRCHWQELLHVRREVLRAGLPVSEAMLAEDSAETTLHVGAFVEIARKPIAVACGSLVLSSLPSGRPGLDPDRQREDADRFAFGHLSSAPAYRLRQMAVDADYRSGGIGRQLLQFGERWIRANTSIRLLWCDARLPAVPFYQREGWRIISDLFYWPTAGPHHRMIKELR